MRLPDPDTRFHFDNLPAKLNDKTSNVIDFWKWAYSDLSQNVTKGMVGQYIVACTLEQTILQMTDGHLLIYSVQMAKKLKSKQHHTFRLGSKKRSIHSFLFVRPMVIQESQGILKM